MSTEDKAMSDETERTIRGLQADLAAALAEVARQKGKAANWKAEAVHWADRAEGLIAALETVKPTTGPWDLKEYVVWMQMAPAKQAAIIDAALSA